MSNRSRAWADYSPPSSASSSSSPGSKSSGYHSAATPSTSSMSSEKRGSRESKRKMSPMGNQRSCLDLERNEEFLKAEEELKKDHVDDYHIYLDVPEVHPDYNSNFQTFLDLFSKRFGDDPVRCKNLWRTYWYEIIKEKQEQEWRVKRAVLIKQFQIKLTHKGNPLKNRKILEESQSSKSKSKMTEKGKIATQNRTIECIDIIDEGPDIAYLERISSSEKYPASKVCNPSVPFSEVAKRTLPHEGERTLPRVVEKTLPHGEEEKLQHVGERTLSPHGDNSLEEFVFLVSSEKVDTDGEVAKLVSIGRSLELLEDICDDIGDVFGSILRRVVIKMKSLKTVKDITLFLNNHDTRKLLQFVSEKLTCLSAVAEGVEKRKLNHCSKIALKLIDTVAGDKTREKYGGLDLKRVAEETYNKDISYTLGIIRESLRYNGFDNPTPEIINNVFAEVSSCHIKMSLNKG